MISGSFGSLDLNWLGGHASNVHRGPDAGPWRRGRIACRAALQPGGSYGLACSRPEGGSGYTDQQVYERASLGGGLGYSEDSLRALWDRPPFRMRRTSADAQDGWPGTLLRRGLPLGAASREGRRRVTQRPARSWPEQAWLARLGPTLRRSSSAAILGFVHDGTAAAAMCSTSRCSWRGRDLLLVGGTASTGQGAWRSTYWLTAPRTLAILPRRVARTMSWARVVQAALTSARPGWSATTR